MVVHECRTAKTEDFVALKRMLELYQYEISDMYDQDLDASGEYGYNLTRHMECKRFFAHVVLVKDRYAGFALVAPSSPLSRQVAMPKCKSQRVGGKVSCSASTMPLRPNPSLKRSANGRPSGPV